MTQNTHKNKAFTLIELLVVIAIIGILSSVVLASLSGARESARDARRQQDMQQINTAIQMYMNDNNGSPPFEGVDSWYQTISGNWSTLESELQPYMSSLPVDPVDSMPFVYTYRAGGSVSYNADCTFNENDDSYMFLAGFQSVDPDNFYPQGQDNRYCIIY